MADELTPDPAAPEPVIAAPEPVAPEPDPADPHQSAPSPSAAPPSISFDATGNDPAAIAKTSGYRNWSALDGVPPRLAEVAKSLVNYNVPVTPYMFAKSPLYAAAAQLANRVNPAWTAGDYEVRQKVRNDFATGEDSKGVRALNQALYHLGDMHDQVQALGNVGGFPFSTDVNAVKNWYKEHEGDRHPGIFRETGDAASSEIVKATRGTGGSEKDIENWRANLPVNGSPEQQEGQIKKAIDILSGSISSYRQKYMKGMGEPPIDFPFIDPRGRQILTKLGIDPDKVELGMSGEDAKLSPADYSKFGNAKEGDIITLPRSGKKVQKQKDGTFLPVNP